MNELIVSKQRQLAALRDEMAGFEKRNQDRAAREAKAKADLAEEDGKIRECRIEAVLNPKAISAIPTMQKNAARLRDEIEQSEVEGIALGRRIGELAKLIAQAEQDERQAKRDALIKVLVVLRDHYQTAYEAYVKAFEELSVGVGEMALMGGLGQLKEHLPVLLKFPQPSHSTEAGLGAPSVLILERGHDGMLRHRFPFMMGKERRAEILAELLK